MAALFKKAKKEEGSETINKPEYTAGTTMGFSQPQQFPYQYDPYRYQDPFSSQGYAQQFYYPSPSPTPPFQQGFMQPTPQSFSQPQQESGQESWESYIQGIIEEVIEDKLQNIDNVISELKIWREKVELEISKINERINNLDNRINNLYDMLANKIKEYDKGIREATVEVEALHRLIRTMIPAISESTKELKETIEEIKNLRDQLKRP